MMRIDFQGALVVWAAFISHEKNCPSYLKGHYHNPKDGKLTAMSCESLCDRELYCWHCYAGRIGTNNGIKVLYNSSRIKDILGGTRSMNVPRGYAVNGMILPWLPYIIVSGIYADWSILVGSSHSLLTDKEQPMSKGQEAVRKDVEMLLGRLHAVSWYCSWI